MFERYTEKARRSIFFARYEASQLGTPVIAPEVLLLGLIRESRNLLEYLRVDRSELENRLRAGVVIGAKISTSVDIPLDDGCKRVLAHAAQEADRLNHRHIGSEHLLLGVMREERSRAAQVLRELGAPSADEVKKAIVDAAPTIESGPTHSRSNISRLPAVVVVEEETGRELSVRPGFSFTPRIGETIVIARSGASERYLVADVEWKLMEGGEEDELVQTGIEVRVRKEAAREG
jgi:ATP-dependent Clp protease ATP-binding subunit ClpA